MKGFKYIKLQTGKCSFLYVLVTMLFYIRFLLINFGGRYECQVHAPRLQSVLSVVTAAKQVLATIPGQRMRRGQDSVMVAISCRQHSCATLLWIKNNSAHLVIILKPETNTKKLNIFSSVSTTQQYD